MDDQEEIITLSNQNETDIASLTDRGDEVSPELSKDNLSAVVDNADDAPEEDAPAEESTRQSARIPKARFDEVNNERKEALRAAEEARERAAALEREIQALRQGAKQPAPAAQPKQEAPSFDEDAKEQEYTTALMEGDTTKAHQIRREINSNLRQQAAHEAQIMVEQQLTQRQAAAALQAASQQAVADFPYLETPEGAEALDLIIASRDAKIARGIPAHQALSDAVKSIAPKFAPDESTRGGLPNTTKPTDTRTAAAIARGAADANLQPPAVQAGIGARANAGRVNVEALTEDQFKNLSAEDKKRLRGD